MKKGCLVGLALLAIPVGLVGSFLAYRKPWVEPLPDVDMTPELGFLYRKDLVPGTGTELLIRTLERPEWDDLSNLRAQMDEVRDGGWPPADPGPVEEGIVRFEPLVEELRVALDDPSARTVSALSLTEHRPWISRALPAGRLLSLLTLRALALEEGDEAFRNFDLQLDLARAMGRGGPTIDWLVAIALQLQAIQTVSSLPGISRSEEEVLRWIGRLIEAETDLQSWPETLRYEMHGIASVAEEMKALQLDGLLMGSRPPSAMRALGWLGPLRGSHPAAIRANLLAVGQHVVRAAENPDDPVAQASVEELVRKPGPMELLLSEDPVGRILVLVTLPALEGAPARHLRSRRDLWGASAMLAVHLHEREHGSLPEDLASLAPAYLPEAWPERRAEFGFRLERDDGGGWAVTADLTPGESPDPGRPLRWGPVRTRSRPAE